MTPPLPILYTFRRCPYAMRARLALYTAKISHEHREVDLKNKPAEMIAISPKGTVPVLQLPDGKILEESLDIMKWALDKPSLSEGERQLITENDTVFKQALDRYKYPQRYGFQENDRVGYRSMCEQFLQKLEECPDLFCKGTNPAFIEMALFPFVRQFSGVDANWFSSRPYPRLQNWLASFGSGRLFKQVMHEHTVWQAGNTPNVVAFQAL